MAYSSNIAAINAANQALKNAGFQASAAILKAARAEHFKIEKVEGEWHALIIKPLPDAQSMADAIVAQASPSLAAEPQESPASEPEQAPSEPSKAEIVAEARKSHLIGSDAASQAAANASQAGQAAFANAAAFFASRAAMETLVELHPELAAAEQSMPDDVLEAQRQADALANAQQSASDLKGGKVWIHVSSCESPVKRVWAIADAMIAQAAAANRPRPSRKEIQDECVRQGVASGTARTQYQAWKKANDNDAANAQRAAELSAALNGKHKA